MSAPPRPATARPAPSRIDAALPRLFQVIADEAAANPAFAARLETALEGYAEALLERRRSERRIASFHPIIEARRLEPDALRDKLMDFDAAQLRLLIEAHNLDPAKSLKPRASKKALVEHVFTAACRRVARDAQLFEY